jgi:hypothetical protein
MMDRRQFAAGTLFSAIASPSLALKPPAGDELDAWQRDTDLVSADTYREYLKDGDTRNLAALEKLELAFDKVLREAAEAKVDKVPAVWSLYNMGYIVKTRESLFAIDLVHRRAPEFAPLLDFALVTHNHGDHCHQALYRALNSAGKTVISNFLDNYGAKDWRRNGGYTRAEKTFAIKDVQIRTSLVDHNSYLLDFTTAFEIKAGDWLLYHTGDCGLAGKLGTVWGRPDLWLFFPGCGIDVEAAIGKVRPKRVVFGHLWELAHRSGRLTTPMIRAALRKSTACDDVSVRFWGERITPDGGEA